MGKFLGLWRQELEAGRSEHLSMNIKTDLSKSVFCEPKSREISARRRPRAVGEVNGGAVVSYMPASAPQERR